MESGSRPDDAAGGAAHGGAINQEGAVPTRTPIRGIGCPIPGINILLASFEAATTMRPVVVLTATDGKSHAMGPLGLPAIATVRGFQLVPDEFDDRKYIEFPTAPYSTPTKSYTDAAGFQ